MTSIKVNKNINHLGKPASNMITTNEYTLYLLPLPLFSVDILDSKISANNFTQYGIGMETPILFRLRLLKTPFGKERSGQRHLSKQRPFFHIPRERVAFTLHPEIEYVNT